MVPAELPTNESERLAALLAYDIMDTQSEAAFDDLAGLAASILDMPIALVSLLDSERQWFKAKVGLAASETPRQVAFCSHAILHQESVLEVEDARADLRFCENPLVTSDPHIQFYAGAPLVTPDGLALGTLCVIDQKPRKLTEQQRQLLLTLSRQVVTQLELHKKNRELQGLIKQLADSNRELEDFASIVSHDLKEPLRGIYNYAIFLVEDYGEQLDDDNRASLAALTRLAKRMEALIDSLLYYSRVGRVDLARQATDLEKTVDGVLETLSFRLQEAHIAVRRPTPLPTLTCDAARVGEIFRNLLTNAIKYNDKLQKWVEIGAYQGVTGEADHPGQSYPQSATPGQWVFYVRDNGIGIREKHQAKIFGIFKRLHNRDQYGGGTGIGLTIVKKIVERHGGQLWVESTVGEGTTFYFTLQEKA